MHWSDEGIVINTRRHGESRLIASILTLGHGRHLGILRESPKVTSSFQAGAKIVVRWNARLSEHLGHWAGDLVYSPLAEVLESGTLLAALSSACALVEMALPEREPHPEIYQAFHHFIYSLSTAAWPDAYIYLERALLENAGVQLDFRHCGATGSTEDLIYVSPRTGCAISREAGAPYHDKLLPLPPFLTHTLNLNTERKPEEILKALEMMEKFLARFILGIHHLKMPDARDRLKAKLRRQLQLVRAA